MGLPNNIKGVSFALLIYLSSSLGIIYFAGWWILLLFVNGLLFRPAMDFHIGFWFTYAAALLELFLGIKVVITGDEIRHGERNLLIMNHRTRLDWMYLWSVLVRQSGVKTEKIILKAPLKYVPGAGWAMQSACLLFIKRKWEEDKVYLTKMLDYFAAVQHKTQILLFPEGTDLTPKTKSSSDSFAKKNNLPFVDYVLHPRTTGFNFVVQKMRGNDHLDAVYDISIAYPYNFPQNEPELLKGNFPREVHFHIKRYPVESLPESDEGLGDWCKKRWDEKEVSLKKFYTEDKCFPGEQIQDKCSGNRNIQVTLWIAAIYWTVFVFGILVILYYSSLARWVGVFQIVFHLYMSHRGGFELFQAELFSKWTGIAKKSS